MIHMLNKSWQKLLIKSYPVLLTRAAQVIVIPKGEENDCLKKFGLMNYNLIRKDKMKIFSCLFSLYS